jgi:hypothetical protein
MGSIPGGWTASVVGLEFAVGQEVAEVGGTAVGYCEAIDTDSFVVSVSELIKGCVVGSWFNHFVSPGLLDHLRRRVLGVILEMKKHHDLSVTGDGTGVC